MQSARIIVYRHVCQKNKTKHKLGSLIQEEHELGSYRVCNEKTIVPKCNHAKNQRTCLVSLRSLTLGASFSKKKCLINELQDDE